MAGPERPITHRNPPLAKNAWNFVGNAEVGKLRDSQTGAATDSQGGGQTNGLRPA